MPRSWSSLFRWSLFLLAGAYLWRQLALDESTSALAWVREGAAWPSVLLPIGALMLVNWGLEAAKWALLMRPVERLSLPRAFAATLAGTSVSLITPNRTGEFVGRVLFIRPEARIEAAALTVLGSIAQVLITLVAGAAGLSALWAGAGPLPLEQGWAAALIVLVAVVFACIAGALFLFPGLLRHVLDLFPLLRRFDPHFRSLQDQPRSRSLAVLGLSALRYAVFIGQGVLSFRAFAPDVPPLMVLLAMPVVYLIATLVPTVMLTDLGVRGSVAVFVFAPMGAAASQVLTATSVVWTINVLLPALSGAVVLMLAGIRSERSVA